MCARAAEAPTHTYVPVHRGPWPADAGQRSHDGVGVAGACLQRLQERRTIVVCERYLNHSSRLTLRAARSADAVSLSPWVAAGETSARAAYRHGTGKDLAVPQERAARGCSAERLWRH